MKRSSFVVLMLGTAGILIFGAGLMGNQDFYGVLIGYWMGFGYTVWIHWESVRSSELETKLALRRMRRGFLGRLGMVTLVVVAVARFQADWLFHLALGIAIGVILSIITVAIHMFRGEGGDK